MQGLINLISNNEDWLLNHIISFAKKYQFSKYTPTLEEAWCASIRGVSRAITEAAEKLDHAPELGPDENYARDPIAAYGIYQARMHRNRGVNLSMFMGLLKYYCQSYLDLIKENEPNPVKKEAYRLFIRRCFDRMEIGFCMEWAEQTESTQINDLRRQNRQTTLEKIKYLTIFESLSNPVIILDTDDKVVNLNHSAKAIFGLSGKPGAGYYGEKEADSVLPWLAAELTEFHSSEHQDLIVEKEFDRNGVAMYFQVSMKKMLDLSDKFRGTVIICDDIIKHKHLEKELKEKKDFAESLVMNSAIPTFLLDKNHKVIMWNKAMVEQTGISAEGIIGTDEYWKAFRETKMDCLANHIINGVPEYCSIFFESFGKSELVFGGIWGEGWFKNFNGQKRYLLAHAAPILSDRGELLAAMETVQDFSYRKMEEEVLFENEQMFRATFSQAAVGMVHIELDGSFILCNQRFCEIMGYRPDELRGMKTRDVIYPDDYKSNVSNALNLISGKESSFTMEQRVFRKDHKLIWIRLSATMVHDSSGLPKYYLSIVDDITVQKMAEEQLMEKNRRMRKELEMAAKTQAELLPRTIPCFPGVAVSWEFSPSVYVAGDMLNLFRLNDNQICFYILDVMGHGLAAALKAAMVSLLLKPAENSDHELSKPSLVLEMLNRHFSKELQDGRFFTIFYGVFNKRTREFTYSSAGHCPPILLRAAGDTEELSFRNPAVGLSEKVVYRDQVVSLTPGDKVIMYTDGITEARNGEGLFYSKNRLIDFIRQNRNEPISSLVPNILQDVKTFAGAIKPADDLTLLGVEMLME